MRILYFVPVLLAGLLPAQDFRATLNGHVTDPHNAPIAAAGVALRNIDKNETLRHTTDQRAIMSSPWCSRATTN
jgi:hypothetical protein